MVTPQKSLLKENKILSVFPDEFDSNLMILIDLRCFFSCASAAPHLTSGLQKLIKYEHRDNLKIPEPIQITKEDFLYFFSPIFWRK